MKTVNNSILNSQFSKITRAISGILGVKPMAFKVVPLRMYRLTQYNCPLSGLTVNLKEYFIDEEGDLYSRNTGTYITDYGKKLEKLSNNCARFDGDFINSLRDVKGNKVTVRRSVLVNMMKLGKFEDVTDNKIQSILKGA